jgi:hypothetical protein
VLEKDPLTHELARMHRGRGLRSPDLDQLVGTRLRHALGLSSGQLTPTEVLDRMRDAIATLPPDLQVVFLHAVGARSTEHFLKERLEAAGAVLDRDARTVRRRLTQANALVAQALLSPETTSPATQPVRYLTHQAETDLRDEVIRLTSTKSVLRRRSGTISLTERFGVPGAGTTTEPPLKVRGADLSELRPISGSVWEAELQLPAGDSGCASTYSLVVELPDRAALSPFTVVVPMQVFNACSVRVHFGAFHPVRSVREVHGALPVTLYEPPATGPHDQAPPPTAALNVERPQLGVAYGFAWSWLSDIASE